MIISSELVRHLSRIIKKRLSSRDSRLAQRLEGLAQDRNVGSSISSHG